MIIDGLIAEGNIAVTSENKSSLIGKKIINPNHIFVWIPKYAKYNDNALFLYSTSERFVNSNGELSDLSNEYTINSAFDNITGFWIAKADYNDIVTTFERNVNISSNIENNVKNAVIGLSQSNYGKNANEFTTISVSRQMITID